MKLDYELLVAFEKYKKAIDEKLGFIEAQNFEKFVEVLWLTHTDYYGRRDKYVAENDFTL